MKAYTQTVSTQWVHECKFYQMPPVLTCRMSELRWHWWSHWIFCLPKALSMRPRYLSMFRDVQLREVKPGCIASSTCKVSDIWCTLYCSCCAKSISFCHQFLCHIWNVKEKAVLFACIKWPSHQIINLKHGSKDHIQWITKQLNEPNVYVCLNSSWESDPTHRTTICINQWFTDFLAHDLLKWSKNDQKVRKVDINWLNKERCMSFLFIFLLLCAPFCVSLGPLLGTHTV